jgi:exosortase
LSSATTDSLVYMRRSRNEPPDDPIVAGLSLTAWLKIFITAALFGLLFWPNLWRIWGKTNPLSSAADANWQHALAIPIIGLYYLYANREQILATPVRAAWTGAIIALIGILIFGYGIWPGQNDFVKDVGMMVTLFGVVLLLVGWRMMKIVWFPVLFLWCGVPWPGLFYSLVSSPLQHLAASVAVLTLQLTGVDAIESGNKIIMHFMDKQGRPATAMLDVAEACSGLKALMTFITVAAAVAFLSVSPLWQKLIIVLSAIPIAIFCNVMRVAGQGLLHRYVSPEFSQGFAHQFVGLVMLIPAFFMILLVGWVLDRLFVDEVEDKDRPQPRVLVRKTLPTGGQS